MQATSEPLAVISQSQYHFLNVPKWLANVQSYIQRNAFPKRCETCPANQTRFLRSRAETLSAPVLRLQL
jgi:hypothetical protein